MSEKTPPIHPAPARARERAPGTPPVFHASTILSETVGEFRRRRQDWILEQPGTYYGRFGTPTIEALQEAITALEGGHRSVVYPSELAAYARALLDFLLARDCMLIHV